MIKFWYLFSLLYLPIITFSQPLSNDSKGKENTLFPGATTSIPFTIKNTGNDTLNYEIVTVTSAPVIIAIINKGNIKIPPHGSYIYIVPIRVTQNAIKGNYTINIQVANPHSALKFFQSKTITVIGLRKITLTKIASQDYLRAGDTVKSSFLLENEGNTEETLQLECNAHILNSTGQFNLNPGASKVIYVEQSTIANLSKNDNTSIQLSAISTDGLKKKWSAFSSTTVLTTHPEDKDVYFRFPVEASVSYIGMRQQGYYNGGFQGELYGKGSLSKENLDVLEFHAVTASPIPFNSFSKYEEYFVNYQNKQLYGHLGDKSFSSSYLTEYYRYGRGAELHYSFNNLTIGGFYNRPRFFRDIKDEFNVFSKLHLKNSTDITAGYLYKTPNPDNNSSSLYQLKENTQLPYVMVNSGIFKDKLNLEAEVAYSYSKSENGLGYRLQMSSYISHFTGNIQYIKAGPHFNGYFKNSDAINGNVSYRLLSKISLSGNYNQDARNIQRDTLFLSAPLRKTYQLGLTYRYLTDGNLSLYAGNRRYKDRLEPRQFDYMEKFARISLDHRLSSFNVNLETEFGKTTNYLTGITGNSQYYTANLSFEKWHSSINLYGNFANTTRYQENNQQIFYYGARLMSRFKDKSYLSVFYQNDYQPEDYYKNRNLFELQYHQSLSFNHEIELSGRYTLQQGQLYNKDYIFSLKYIVHLNLPVQRVAEYTMLSGNIQNLGMQRINGIRIWLGNHSTLTDALGNYTFKNVVPGDYMIDIDRSSIDVNGIPTLELPAPIKLAKEAGVFNFGLTTAAKITGRVILERADSANSETSKLLASTEKRADGGQIIIEATDGTQSYRKICSLNSPFDFTYLRPGSWTINVYRNGLNKNYRVLENKFNFELKPNSLKQLQIHIVKEQMKIKFQEGGIKVSYSDK